MKKKKLHPNTGKTYALKHGAHSGTVRARFDDMRCTQGKALHNVMQNLIGDLGGEAALTAPMRILIDSNVRPKLITILLINDHINKLQGDILKEDGSLIGCLGTNYIAFSNGLRRDLEVLVEMAAKAGKINKGVPTIEQLIQVNKT